MNIESDDDLIIDELKSRGLWGAFNSPEANDKYGYLEDGDNWFLSFGHDEDGGFLWVQFEETDSPEYRESRIAAIKENLLGDSTQIEVISDGGLDHTAEFGIYHWDTFDNETFLVGEADTFNEAKKIAEEKYKGRIGANGADQVDIVNKSGKICYKFKVS